MGELLLDTTYLLPIFGISVGLKNFDDAFERMLSSFSVLYNPASLIEAKWTVLKLSRSNSENKAALFKAYRTGLKTLLADDRLEQTFLTNDAVEAVADDLLTRDGVKDYFDRLLYATAADEGCSLLTEDEKLSKLKKLDTPRPREVLAWSDIVSQ
jgi:hypothetical protein